MPNSDLDSQKQPTETESVDQIEPRKPAIRILEQQIRTGLGELERPADGLLLAGFSAGLDLGFSVFLIAFFLNVTQGVLPRPFTEILMAYGYTVGFIFVVLGRSELFTEHTTLAVLPVLNRRASVTQLGRLWGLIYTSNLVGALISSILIVVVGPALGIIKLEAFRELASLLVDHSFWVIFLSGILAGWLMGLLSWLVAAGRDTISQIVIIGLVTSTIAFLHLHHSIAGSIEVLVGLFSGKGITVGEYFYFLLWSTLGNSIGGVVFVAVIKYGHGIRPARSQDDVNLEGEE